MSGLLLQLISVPVLAFLVGTGLQLSGVTNLRLAIGLWVVAVILMCWRARVWYKQQRDAGMISLEPSHLIALGLVGLAISGTVAAGGYIWSLYHVPDAGLPDGAQGYPIAWRWVGWNRSSTDGYAVLRVGGVRFVGKNISEKEVLFSNASIISGITGTRLTPKILLPGTEIEPKDANPIPAGAEIILDARFEANVTAEEYLKEWGTFSLVTECDGKTYRVTVAETAVKARFEQVHPKPGAPHVTKRTENASTPSVRGPTLETTNNSKIDAAGAEMPGDLPFQFGRAENSSLIDIRGIKVTKTEKGYTYRAENVNREFSTPTGEFASMLVPELRRRIEITSGDLHRFQDEFDKEFFDPNHKWPSEEKAKTVLAKFGARYEERLAGIALSLASVALRKIGTINGSDMSPEARDGVDIVYHGKFVGTDPAKRAAAFLELLESRLPQTD